MKLEEAQRKLLLARKRQKKLRLEIDALRKIIVGYGVDPDERFAGLKERNKEIYEFYKKKMTFTAIAEKCNLSKTSIAVICHRIDGILARKKARVGSYKN